MRAGRTRYVVVGAMLLAAAVLSQGLGGARAERYDVMLTELPTSIGPWRGRDVELTKPDIVYAVLETTAVLTRRYAIADTGSAVDLLVTYFRRGHRGFHPPEVSFVASGNTIVRAGVSTIPLGREPGGPAVEADMFLGRTPAGDEMLFLYWFLVGERTMASYYRSALHVVWDTIRGRSGTASMVRLALPVSGGDVDGAMARAAEFTRELMPILPRYLRERAGDDTTRRPGTAGAG